jgi:cation transport regulator ChaC
MNGATWLFGYGSLIWRPDFPYLDSRRSFITGWTRRFWQGSHDHRGVESDPGRVVTLVDAQGERCYGRAFLIEPETFSHLDHREKNGYGRHIVEIHFHDTHSPGVVYIGPNGNPAFLGDAPLAEMAAQIRRCVGQSGTNTEYLLRLAHSLRELNIVDPHVFELEAQVLAG